MKEININKFEAGQRLDKFLLKYLNKSGSAFIYKMLRKKNIVLNDKKATGNEKLEIGDNVKLYLADETIEKFSDITFSISNIKSENSKQSKKLDVIYEDDDILLINKHVGVLSQKATPNDYSLNEMAIDYLLSNSSITKEQLHTFKPSVCNRLDRNTTGLIAVGKSLKGTQFLSLAFKERTLSKYYLALVYGIIDSPKTIEGYLVKDQNTNKVNIYNKKIDDTASYIKTAYKPIEVINNTTLLEVELITGKTHQIRAHLASIDHPIVGDSKYGGSKINGKLYGNDKIKYQLLHSYRLVFPDEIEGDMNYLQGKEFIAKQPSFWPIKVKK